MKTTIFRIYTEGRDNLPSIVARYFEGFTVLTGAGYFRGVSEPSTVIEVIDEGDSVGTRARVYDLADDIKRTNNQQVVYVTETDTYLWSTDTGKDAQHL